MCSRFFSEDRQCVRFYNQYILNHFSQRFVRLNSLLQDAILLVYFLFCLFLIDFSVITCVSKIILSNLTFHSSNTIVSYMQLEMSCFSPVRRRNQQKLISFLFSSLSFLQSIPCSYSCYFSVFISSFQRNQKREILEYKEGLQKSKLLKLLKGPWGLAVVSAALASWQVLKIAQI